ncbi:MAG: family 16 glycoside hydrolase [Planctomycetaceae bacterium]
MNTTTTASCAAALLLFFIGPVSATEPIPDKLVVLTFDDSAKSHFTVARPLLLDYGFGATFFITEGFDFRENKRDYMTWEQIAELHRDGFEIGNHTRDHLGISDAKVEKLPEQLQGISDRCQEHGIPVPVTFAWPGNQTSHKAFDVLQQHGIKFARRGGAPEFPYEQGRGFAYEPGNDHPLLIPSAGDARPNWNLSDLIRAVEQAKDGRIAVLQFHGVPDTAHSWVNSPEQQFEAYMKYLSVNGYKVIAMRDLEKYVNPNQKPEDPEAIIRLRQQIVAELPIAAVTPQEFVGHWALRMHNGDAGWLSIEQTAGEWSAELWTVGQPKAVAEIRYTNGQLNFVRQCRIGKPEYVGGPPTGRPQPCDFVATVHGNSINIKMTAASGDMTVVERHQGQRLPDLPKKPDLSTVRFGEPIELFNGVDLTGWEPANPNQINGWKAVNGELVNESPKETFEPFSRYGNLRTTQVFGDQKLSIEFNVPANGNSGIYVRGAYEVQVTDRDCEKMQGIQGVGAIFNRIQPTKNAGKPGGEWQTYEITIVDRHATVVLNGERVIDNQPILGNTNGAFQADVMSPGPLYLQGDHTAVRYRNIVVRPVIVDNAGIND